jgi:hypothetical protein
MGSSNPRGWGFGWFVLTVLVACATGGTGTSGEDSVLITRGPLPEAGAVVPEAAPAPTSTGPGLNMPGGDGTDSGTSSGDDGSGSSGATDSAASGCASSCTSGCCDNNGACNAGTDDSACGVQGATCADCTASMQTCQSGSCGSATSSSSGGSSSGSSGSSGSSSGSSGGRGNCNLLSCLTGCCQSGTCMKPSDTTCGNLGNSCRDCTATGQTCMGGNCSGRRSGVDGH